MTFVQVNSVELSGQDTLKIIFATEEQLKGIQLKVHLVWLNSACLNSLWALTVIFYFNPYIPVLHEVIEFLIGVIANSS